LDERAAHWKGVANTIQTRLIEQAWNEKHGASTAAIGIDDFDASVLVLPEIGLLKPMIPVSWKRSNVNFYAASTLCVVRARTTSACRKRLLICAGSS
jgi:hypothetical protein